MSLLATIKKIIKKKKSRGRGWKTEQTDSSHRNESHIFTAKSQVSVTAPKAKPILNDLWIYNKSRYWKNIPCKVETKTQVLCFFCVFIKERLFFLAARVHSESSPSVFLPRVEVFCRECRLLCVRAGYFPPPLNPLQMGVCGVGGGVWGGGAIRDLPSGAQESAAMQDWWHPPEETKDVPPARTGLWDLIDSSLNKHHWYVSHGVFPPTAASWREQNAPPCCLRTLTVLTSRKTQLISGRSLCFLALSWTPSWRYQRNIYTFGLLAGSIFQSERVWIM